MDAGKGAAGSDDKSRQEGKEGKAGNAAEMQELENIQSYRVHIRADHPSEILFSMPSELLPDTFSLTLEHPIQYRFSGSIPQAIFSSSMNGNGQFPITPVIRLEDVVDAAGRGDNPISIVAAKAEASRMKEIYRSQLARRGYYITRADLRYKGLDPQRRAFLEMRIDGIGSRIDAQIYGKCDPGSRGYLLKKHLEWLREERNSSKKIPEKKDEHKD